MTEIVAIVVGFALTTVAGGWWAAHLQQRSWRNQNDVRLMEAERQRAAQVCGELSQLLDKRLYRMRRLYWAVQDHMRSGTAEGILDRRLKEYDEVLYEWNDTLNLNLAWIGTYFGDAATEYLDASYERFRAAGLRLEDAVNRAHEGIDVSGELDELNPEFEGWRADSLNQRNYLLVLAMNTQLREGRVGRNAPDKLPVPSLRG